GEVKGVPDREKRGYVVFPADVLLGEKEVLWRVWREIGCWLPSKLSKGSSEFPLTADRRICKNCDFALLCDRLDT
ncbi:MAG: hypothetical protein N2170_09155, partial [Bacteroidia bacterium]|nr:hypothetical protein [Bacteroidia bacterium]